MGTGLSPSTSAVLTKTRSLCLLHALHQSRLWMTSPLWHLASKLLCILVVKSRSSRTKTTSKLFWTRQTILERRESCPRPPNRWKSWRLKTIQPTKILMETLRMVLPMTVMTKKKSGKDDESSEDEGDVLENEYIQELELAEEEEVEKKDQVVEEVEGNGQVNEEPPAKKSKVKKVTKAVAAKKSNKPTKKPTGKKAVKPN